jgi:hypothetical protein
MAEGTESDIPEKLGIEPGMTVVVLHEPNWFQYDLGELPDGVTVHRDSFERPADLFLIFAATPDEAERGFQRALTVLPADGAVWVVWERDPPETFYEHVSEQTLRELFGDSGLVPDESSVINETWQGLRFVVAEENRGRWEQVRTVRD